MPSSVWKGSITFGLLSIPIRMYTAARSDRTYLHQIHKKCNSRVKQPLFCPVCNRQVDRSEIIKGYEYEEGQYLLIDADEIKKITPKSGRTVEILAFVKESQIDPIYFDASYFAMPEKESEKPYALLLKALEDTDRVGVAKLTMHQREYTVFIRPRNHGLTIHTMYFANEIREVAGYGKQDENISLKPQEVKLAEQLIETLSEDFNPKQYHDTFQENLKALIAAKQQGKSTVAETAAPRRAPVIDMMEALKRSLANSEQQSSKRAAKSRDQEEHEPRRRKAS
jgi:DNA end-binding protein Ku